ncbi:membrane protein [Streptomyces longispororuber]|uniref:Membrane protein n=1 Tax=Streptomyces longispororuber TaxID=68230 RepID=A0A919DQP9_9ACTN|nr:MMPL family transporter [Streptomyces longispororuber]GHE66487.1 membrane protein [Streptomyces longispororuber]
MDAKRRNLAARLGVWSAHHRRKAILGWLLFVVLATVVGGATGVVTADESEMGTGDSARAAKILDDAGIDDPAGELVLVKARTPDGWRAAAADVAAAVERTGETTKVRAPLRSADGRDALLRFEIKGPSDKAADRVQPVLDAVDDVRDGRTGRGVAIHQFGDASSEKHLNDLLADDLKKAEFTAVPLALGILLVAFGAVVAALLPVGLAVTACVAAFGLLGLVSHAVHLFETTYSVMFLMGLAVGVDYCLFYLRRERDERAAGHDADTALRIAAATSGRAVLVSGLTVMVAMAGLFLSGLLLFKGFAVATILVVCVAMLGSVTVLPALLAWLGDRVDAGRVPFLHRRSRKGAHAGGAFAGALVRPVLARPRLFAAASAGLLLLLAAPALGMKTEQLGLEKQFGSDAPLSVAYREITDTFPGGPAPARVVVRADTAGGLDAAPVRDGLRALTAKAGKGAELTFHRAERVAVLEVPLPGTGTDAAAKKALDDLRSQVREFRSEVRESGAEAGSGGADAGADGVGAQGGAGVEAYAGGDLAESRDFTDQLGDGILPVFLFIAAVTFLLMLVSFRSVVIAVTSIALNLLSVGAAYGVMTAVFQHGWGASLIGSEKVGAIENWMPLFVLVVLFGLSMDYHVFVVSRIREARDRGLDNLSAIREGITRTAGAVTGAAVIMVAVFAVFGMLSMQDMQQMGVGLGVAVLLDATVVRMVLLPSLMALLGERNWRSPRWLPRGPRGRSSVSSGRVGAGV